MHKRKARRRPLSEKKIRTRNPPRPPSLASEFVVYDQGVKLFRMEVEQILQKYLPRVLTELIECYFEPPLISLLTWMVGPDLLLVLNIHELKGKRKKYLKRPSPSLWKCIFLEVSNPLSELAEPNSREVTPFTYSRDLGIIAGWRHSVWSLRSSLRKLECDHLPFLAQDLPSESLHWLLSSYSYFTSIMSLQDFIHSQISPFLSNLERLGRSRIFFYSSCTILVTSDILILKPVNLDTAASFWDAVQWLLQELTPVYVYDRGFPTSGYCLLGNRLYGFPLERMGDRFESILLDEIQAPKTFHANVNRSLLSDIVSATIFMSPFFRFSAMIPIEDHQQIWFLTTNRSGLSMIYSVKENCFIQVPSANPMMKQVAGPWISFGVCKYVKLK